MTVYDELSDERRALVDRNMGLIGMTMKEFFKLPERDWEDAFQNGYFGLLKAAQRYDFGRGIRFSTYAVNWIRREIGRGRAIDVNERRSIVQRRPIEHPLSLNVQSSFAPEYEIGDLLVARGSESGSLATANVAARAVMRAAVHLCDDAIDLTVVQSIVDAGLDGQRPNLAALARKHGLSDRVLHRRYRRIISHLRSRFPDIGDAVA